MPERADGEGAGERGGGGASAGGEWGGEKGEAVVNEFHELRSQVAGLLELLQVPLKCLAERKLALRKSPAGSTRALVTPARLLQAHAEQLKLRHGGRHELNQELPRPHEPSHEPGQPLDSPHPTAGLADSLGREVCVGERSGDKGLTSQTSLILLQFSGARDIWRRRRREIWPGIVRDAKRY